MERPPSQQRQRARAEKLRPLSVAELERVRDVLLRVLAEIERLQRERRRKESPP